MVSPSSDPSAPAPEVLLARLQALEARVAALEAHQPEAEAAPAPMRPQAVPAPDVLSGGTVLALAGRTCLILGGAFLLRALTDSGAVPAHAGAGLGLAYAGLWAFLAHRSGLKGQGPWAAFQVFAASVIAFPLLFETTVRLKAMSPGLASALLLASTFLFVGIAVRHGLRRVAWIMVLASLAAGLAIMAQTGAVTRFCPFFILTYGAALLLDGREGFRILRWPTALAADLAVLSMTILALSPGGSEDLARDLQPGTVLLAALGLVAVHLGIVLHRILRRPRVVGWFEVFQTAAVLLAGFGGAVRMASASGGTGLLGALALLVGLGCYVTAFGFVEKQAEGSLDFKFLTSLALVAVLAGSLLVLGPQVLACVLLAAGLATTLLGVKYAKTSLQYHGAMYLGAAALGSGLLEGVLAAYLGKVPPGLGSFSPAAFLVFAGLVALHLYPLDRRGDGALTWVERLPSLGFGALGTFALGGLAAAACGEVVKDPGAIAALRTAIVVGLAVGSAGMGRWKAASELPWLSYPVLGCAAVKLILEDLPNGRPATMFLAFTLFGAGLLVVPKLLARPRS